MQHHATVTFLNYCSICFIKPLLIILMKRILTLILILEAVTLVHTLSVEATTLENYLNSYC